MAKWLNCCGEAGDWIACCWNFKSLFKNGFHYRTAFLFGFFVCFISNLYSVWTNQIGFFFAINQQLHIQYTQIPLYGKMTLFNLPGNNIFESLIDQSIMTFDVSHLPDGIYFVIISDEKSRFVKKVFIGA